MLLSRFYIRMNQVPAEGSAGGSGNGMGQGTQAAGTTPPPAPPEAQGHNPLDYYNQPPAPPAQQTPPAGSQSQQTPPPAQPPAPPANVSGYGAETNPPPPAPPAGTPPPATPPPAEPPADVYKDLKVEGVDQTYVESFKRFAGDKKFSPEQAQALFDLKKSEMKAMEDQHKENERVHQDKIKATRAAWGQELRNDPVFGGQNFDTNVHMVNMYISEFLPETNKHLTTTKQMLPPYVMRDLHRNAMEAYKTDTYVNGAEGDSTKGGGDSYDPLDYYKQK